ncbi:hypothetical protein [Tropicibacter sp. S64]|uniref:hypothetical protein n=1 Tax=Tropicibacter sp. S64 TaxID=3415122 RepID=UPI003C7C627B
MFAENKITHDMTEITAFLLSEREKVLSEAEWKFRMRGYGYNIRRTDAGIEVAKLPQNTLIGTIAG